MLTSDTVAFFGPGVTTFAEAPKRIIKAKVVSTGGANIKANDINFQKSYFTKTGENKTK